jgi:hypothetical protein
MSDLLLYVYAVSVSSIPPFVNSLQPALARLVANPAGDLKVVIEGEHERMRLEVEAKRKKLDEMRKLRERD